MLPLFSLIAISQTRENPIISGNVYLMPDADEFANVTLSFSGIGQSVTDADGYYEMEVPEGWNGIVSLSVCDGNFYDFDPPQRSYSNVTANISDENYNASTDTSFIISGTITDKFTGDPLANTTVVFDYESGGPPWSVTITTDDDGKYSFEQLPCWSNTINPGVTDGYFYLEPFTRTYDNISGDLDGQDYTFVNYEKPVPPGWEYLQTGDAHIIAIENTSFPNVCGVELELGDLIGVFYHDEEEQLKCGGFGRWQDENNVALIAQGDDDLTQVKDGFDYFEEITWKVYSYATDEEFLATPDYKTGGFLSSNNKFVPGGLSIVEEIEAFNDNLITIPAGWSGFSSYTKPPGVPLIENILQPINNELVIFKSLDKVYYPDGGINNMLIWSYNKGYIIKVSEEAHLPMYGCEEDNKTVNLLSGWNILPVLSKCEVETETFFSSIVNRLVIVKEVAGTGIYWPEYGINTLPVLEPGRAYFVSVTQNTSVTFQDCPVPE
jgi:hypothetical protein